MPRLPSLLLWLVVAAVAAAPAAAQTAPPSPCAYVAPKPRLSAFEQTVRGGQAVRSGFGLRADRAWVVRVLRSPRSRFVEGFGLASAAERRYLALRERLFDAADVADDYLDREAAAVDGGATVEDDGPRGPYLLVRLTDDLARHEAALRRDFPFPGHLRFAQVAFAERDLSALQDRVDADGDWLDAQGFHFTSSGVDVESNRMELEVITARTDAAAVLGERYGPALAVKVVATTPSRFVCTRPGSYRPLHGGRELRLEWLTNSAYGLERIEVTETSRSVRIGIVERAPNGPVTLEGLERLKRVRLESPLGTRRVVNARTGRPIPLP